MQNTTRQLGSGSNPQGVTTLKAQVFSDYHFELRKQWHGVTPAEFCRFIPFRQDVDLGICAGDLTSFAEPYDEVLDAVSRVAENYEKFIYVLGNHEYFGTFRSHVESTMLRLRQDVPNLVWLRTGYPFEYKGIRFLGDTMWYPESLGTMHLRQLKFSDFECIQGFGWFSDHSHTFLKWLKQECKRDDVVITHHLPLPNSTPERFKDSPTGAAFVNNNAAKLLQTGVISPAIWIHGHTHAKFNYRAGDTEVICHPIGHATEGNLPQHPDASVWDIGEGVRFARDYALLDQSSLPGGSQQEDDEGGS